jgi:hypothetical protein
VTVHWWLAGRAPLDFTFCKVTGSANASNEESVDAVVNVTKGAIAEAKGKVCKDGDVDLSATAAATTIAQAVGKVRPFASTLFVSKQPEMCGDYRCITTQAQQ